MNAWRFLFTFTAADGTKGQDEGVLESTLAEMNEEALGIASGLLADHYVVPKHPNLSDVKLVITGHERVAQAPWRLTKDLPVVRQRLCRAG
jgi:hypothetical protein